MPKTGAKLTKEDVDEMMASDMFYEHGDNPANMNYLQMI